MGSELSNILNLVNQIDTTNHVLQQRAVLSVNRCLTFRNWLIGYYIAEYEMQGVDRAAYGSNLIKEIAKRVKHIKGLTSSQLYTCKKFYDTYPYFLEPIVSSLKESEKQQISILRTLSVKLQSNNNENDTIFRSVTEKSSELMEVNNEVGFSMPPQIIFSRLSYSHFLELLRVEDPLKRMFYEVESVKNCWSVRQLEKAIDTLLCERTQLSIKKESLIAKIKNLPPKSNLEIIRDPLNLEFLGLEGLTEYSESDLEAAIINHLQKFLIELGRGFCFEARQKRISFDNTYYYIDLVFYHRILKCNILIDLKVGTFTHADSGQMQMYLNYYQMEEMSEGDNPPVGIILCADKKDSLVKYATAHINEQLFVSKYLVELPNKKQLEEFINNEMIKYQ